MAEYSSDQVLRNIYGSSATQETLSMLGGNVAECLHQCAVGAHRQECEPPAAAEYGPPRRF